MTITSAELIKMMKSLSQVDEWLVLETSTRRMSRTVGPAGSGEVVGRSLSALLFRDSDTGRGSARVDLAGEDEAAAGAMLAAAAEQAALAVGPGWVLPPPAAPARVEVADPEVIGNLAGVVAEMSAQLTRTRALAIVRAELTAELITHRVASSHEFVSEYQETRLSFDVTLSGGSRRRGAGRRLGAGNFFEALDRARGHDRVRGSARPIEPATYDLVLGPEAVAMPRFGCFAPLVAQASGERIRLGLSRYRPGQKVFARGGDDFTLVSDGTIPFGVLSAPFGPLGEPVRRFVLIEDGKAVDASLDLREGALAGVPPNGGVRNLVLSPGGETAAALSEPGDRPLLTVLELAWLDADPLSGDLTAEVALASLEQAGKPPAVVAGGLLSGNAYELLGRARRSRDTGEAGWYRGPKALRIDRVEVVR
jgi:predicted Zn-dependent protease